MNNLEKFFCHLNIAFYSYLVLLNANVIINFLLNGEGIKLFTLYFFIDYIFILNIIDKIKKLKGE